MLIAARICPRLAVEGEKAHSMAPTAKLLAKPGNRIGGPAGLFADMGKGVDNFHTPLRPDMWWQNGARRSRRRFRTALIAQAPLMASSGAKQMPAKPCIAWPFP